MVRVAASCSSTQTVVSVVLYWHVAAGHLGLDLRLWLLLLFVINAVL